MIADDVRMCYKYEKQSPFLPPIALSWPIDEIYQRMDSETMNRQVPCHKFRTHTLARDHILVALYTLALNPLSSSSMLVWNSSSTLDSWASSNFSYHHSCAAHILLDARS